MSNLENKSISFDTGIKKIAVNDMDGELITVLRIKTSDANVAKKFVEISRNLDEIANSGAEKAKVFEEKYKEYENQKYENIPEDARNEIIIDASIVRIEVLEKMIECGYMIGGEQSGHTIFREFATTGDGELTALQFIQAYCEAGVPASELVACCAQYPQELINVPVSAVGGAKQHIMGDERLWEQVRRQEEALQGEGRILVRPSGTEALIRVMVEAKTVETAHNVAQTLADFIKTL